MTFLLVISLLSGMESDVFHPFPSGVSVMETVTGQEIRWNDREGFLSAEEGMPLLPLVTRMFILPGNCSVTGVNGSLQFTDEGRLGNVQIRAAERLTPTNSVSGTASGVALTGISGENPVVGHHEGTILGAATVVSVSVNPWRYQPDTEELELAETCSISLQWESVEGNRGLSELQASLLEQRLETLADEFGVYCGLSLSGGKASTDYLLITGQDFTGTLAPLVSLLEGRSYSVEVLAVEDISGSWSGRDTQEDIRNCIRYYALNQGTSYVLLAGDEDVVPPRDVYMECEGFVETAPCDLYFADLDGSWDENGNGVFGEWEDSLDLYADVILGRLLFSSQEEAEAIVWKNLEYAGAPEEDWYRQAVLCGAQLFPDIGYTGAKGCEMTAEYFPPSFDIVRSYEFEIGDYSDTYIPVIYGGSGWNHYAGHGNDRGVYWGDFQGIMTVSKMSGFDNQGRYGIHSSIGCHTGDFTDPGTNLPDTLLTLADGGGIACLFNTTWGWEGYWPEIGSSERLCLFTIQQVYDQKAPTLGMAYTSAKDLEIPNMTGPYDRVMQSVLAYSLFGDPALEVLGVGSSTPIPPQPYGIVLQGPNPVAQNSISFKVTGASDSYSVSIFDISGRRVLDTFQVQRNTSFSLDVEDLHPGVYFIYARPPGGTGRTASFVRIR